jgi:hypothetical protein
LAKPRAHPFGPAGVIESEVAVTTPIELAEPCTTTQLPSVTSFGEPLPVFVKRVLESVETVIDVSGGRVELVVVDELEERLNPVRARPCITKSGADTLVTEPEAAVPFCKF